MSRFALDKGWEAALERVPAHLRDGLMRYVRDGVQPGSFLSAVIENDLTSAISNGDDASCAGLRDVVRFLFNYCPGACWGSREKRRAWRGLERAA